MSYAAVATGIGLGVGAWWLLRTTTSLPAPPASQLGPTKDAKQSKPVESHAETSLWETLTKARFPWLRWSRADSEIDGAFGAVASCEECYEELYGRLVSLSELEMALVYQLSSFMKHAINVGGGSSPKWGGWHRVNCARSLYRQSLEPGAPIYPGNGCLGYICETIDDYAAYSGFGGGAHGSMQSQCHMLVGLIAAYCELDAFFHPSSGPFDGGCLQLYVPDEEEFDPEYDAAELTTEKVAERARLRARLEVLIPAADSKIEALISTKAPEAFPIMCPFQISAESPGDVGFGVQDEVRCCSLQTVLGNADAQLIVAQGHDPREWANGLNESALRHLWTAGLDALGDAARRAVEAGIVHDITCPNQLFDRWLPPEMQGAQRPTPTGNEVAGGMQAFAHGGGGFSFRAAPDTSALDTLKNARFSAAMHASQARAKEDEAARWDALRSPLCDCCGLYIAASERAHVRRLALAMARHARLGAESPAHTLSADLMQMIMRYVDFGVTASVELMPSVVNSFVADQVSWQLLGRFCCEAHCRLACDNLAPREEVVVDDQALHQAPETAVDA